jgi:RNA polymerase sigma factor (sigma-70 family)
MLYFREKGVSKSEFMEINRDLVSFFRRFAPPSAEPTDLAANTWLAAVRYFEGRCPLREFVFRVAKRQAGEMWRRDRRRPPAAPLAKDEDGEIDPGYLGIAKGPGPETCLTLAAGREAVARALEAVGDAYREAVRLWLDGRDNFQIAAALDIPYNTARSRLSRGRAQILAALQAELEPA